ncbi:MAG: hypothetical protein NVS2B17_22560 [Candidatus Velthaea sp.]
MPGNTRDHTAMNSPASTSARDRSAIACSIAVHICAFILIADVVRPVLKPPPELLSRAGIFTVTLVPRPVRTRPRVKPRTVAIPIPLARPAMPHLARAAAPAPAVARAMAFARAATLVRVSAPANVRAEATNPVYQEIPEAAPPGHLVLAATPAPAPTPLETASPASAPTAAPTAGVLAANGGLFGKNYRAIPNPPTALAALRAKIAGHFHIRVHVDEAGHAIDVRFLTPMADAAAAEDIRSRLLAMNFIPADCNGLPCSDDLDIAN